MPLALEKFFEYSSNKLFTGRAIQGDITRLRRVFGEVDCLKELQLLDINTLRKTAKYKNAGREDSLSDWLYRVTGLRLADKGNRSVRTKGTSVLKKCFSIHTCA